MEFYRQNYRFAPRDPFNQLNKDKILKNTVDSPEHVYPYESKSSSKMNGDFGSLFYQGDQSDMNIKQVFAKVNYIIGIKWPVCY